MRSFAPWKPNKCSKTAVKISDRSKLRPARTATHVVWRKLGEKPKSFCEKFTSRGERITLYNVWCDVKSLRFLIYERYKKRARCRLSLCALRRYVRTLSQSFLYPFDDGFRFFISRDRNERAHPVGKYAYVSLYFVLCVLNFSKLRCSVVRDIAIKWSRMAMTMPNEAAKYKLCREKIENVWSPAVNVNQAFCWLNKKF